MSNRTPAERRNILMLAFIIIVSAGSLFYNLGGRTLENQDSFRFAEVAQNIHATGDWVMMRFRGDIYVDKPPLHFWNIALAYRLFGVGPWAARFPSAFLGFFGVMMILFFGLRLGGGNRNIGNYAALFLLSSYGYAYYSRTVRLDIEYTFFFSLCLLAFCEGYLTNQRKNKMWLYALSWLSLGAAFLNRGPVAFITLLIVMTFLLFQKGWRKLDAKLYLATAPVFLATVLPWLILLLLHSDFSRYADMLRGAAIMTRHAGPLYYPPEFLLKFFPGSLFLLASLPVLWRTRSAWLENPRMAFILIWTVVYLVVIHLTTVKNHRYLLPVFPAVSIITAWGTDKLLSNGGVLRHAWKYLRIPGAVLAVLLCVAVPVGIWFYNGWIWGPLSLSLIAIGTLVFVLKKISDPVFLVCSFVVMALLFLDLGRTMVNADISTFQKVYTMLQTNRIASDEVLFYKTDDKPHEALSFYYRRLLPEPVVVIPPGNQDLKAVITYPEWTNEVLGAGARPPKMRRFVPSHDEHEKNLELILLSR